MPSFLAGSLSYIFSSWAGAKQKVVMIGHQRPAVAGCGCLLQNRTESFQKPISIGIVFKNVSSLDTPAYDMMQGTRRIYSGLTWHVTYYHKQMKIEKPNFNPVPLSLID